MNNIKRKKIIQKALKQNYVDLPSAISHSYVAINHRFIDVGEKIEFSIFINDYLAHMSLFLQSNMVVDEVIKRNLDNTKKLYISQKEREKYESLMEKKLHYVVEDDSLSLEEKADIIYSSTAEIANSLYQNPNALENVQRSKIIVEPILQSIIHDKNAIKSFIKIIEYDYYTHTHSLNVSIYALCLGSELGLEQKKLNALGRAALLHDLGKSNIDLKILNKPDKLDAFEFKEIKKHSSLGYEIALKLGIKDKNILDGIRHHHEKLDGMGYPDGLKGDEITMFPRIIGICDIFDALTTQRSYKGALRSYDAIFLMKTQMHTHLDMKIVDLFIKMLHD